jgi:DNA-binding NtrC family response regulator
LLPSILIVEDEPLVRLALIELTACAGFKVRGAAAASEALCILEQSPGVGIVVTDFLMPGRTDGLMLAAVIRERWPSIRVVLTSGHLHSTDPRLPLDAVFLAKPFRADTLISTLKNLATGTWL